MRSNKAMQVGSQISSWNYEALAIM